jgi:hypothetical protein
MIQQVSSANFISGKYEISSNINRTSFLKRRDFHAKQNYFTGSLEGNTYNRYKVPLRAYLLFVSSDHDE